MSDRPMKVLIVGPDAGARHDLAAVLRDAGYDVVLAVDDPVEAVFEAHQLQPDVVLLRAHDATGERAWKAMGVLTEKLQLSVIYYS